MATENNHVPATGAIVSHDETSTDMRKLWQRPELNRLNASYAANGVTAASDGVTVS